MKRTGIIHHLEQVLKNQKDSPVVGISTEKCKRILEFIEASDREDDLWRDCKSNATDPHEKGHFARWESAIEVRRRARERMDEE